MPAPIHTRIQYRQLLPLTVIFTFRSDFLTAGKAQIYLILTGAPYWEGMFEGTISENGFEKAMESSDLRLLEWSVLCARLSASRDLRRVVSNQGDSSAGNFACFSSGSDAKLNENSVAVNPDDLGEPKNNGSNMPDTANGAATGDREF